MRKQGLAMEACNTSSDHAEIVAGVDIDCATGDVIRDGTVEDANVKVDATTNRSPLEHLDKSSTIEIGLEDDEEASIVVFAPLAKLLYGDGR